ncbi:glycogen/starch/alpha-glucan phosphorylase [Intestinibacter bartlettii]|uniref:Alpha-1,4 glucan phosphorylase n=1 Tax=Intestinibacter bartlettii TaxID=261299 RepID=A0ABS6DXS8_9FIRM|nr:glycogen/starch/alpha-glucan phosphorylase [Intestinibacter bartlettii]MBU5336359.1 glycogen/starch/alpha-glucan family phosphorylase [Intestinibacter bartlettii]
MNLSNVLETKCGKDIASCTNEEIYFGLLSLVDELANQKQSNKGKKKVYYISAEFLIGKLLSNNLINLGIYEEVKSVLEENGKNLSDVEEVEPEPSLGNGGLGRLAACFLDSIATLGLNGDGIGLNYHFGLFKQVFKDKLQLEQKNEWIEKNSWLNKTDVTYDIECGGFKLKSRLYDINVIGYNNRVNKLHLFDVETIDESIVKDGSINFDKEDIPKNLTLFLYPDDSDEDGRLLRVYQQYFMVSNAARLILDECEAKGSNLYDLYDYAVIQINDTHPTMVIPELIRLLNERGISMDDAIEIVSKTCAYTNHTILAEALEKWPMSYLEKAVPNLIDIIRELDKRVREKYEDKDLYIIDEDNRVHMARIDIHYCFSVNGVASLHTEILEKNELNNFYEIYPEKFNNKTNGITFRRWLMHCNHELTNLIEDLIGDGFKTDANELEKLGEYVDNKDVLQKLLNIKFDNKVELKNYIKQHQGIEINENSIFDIQIKRLHEYKRQQMNALYVIYKYLEIKNGNIPSTPITVIFGAKAAPAYTIAKDIIHLILCLQELINNDEEVNKYLNVVMVENYNVTYAEKLIPACDISEQISLASKEASGTGNMKFMLNGALTLGTEDGANVEIHELVGDDNIFIFGKDSETVIKHYENGDYESIDIYARNPKIKDVVDFIIGKELMSIGNAESLIRLFKEIVKKDWFMALLDLEDYIKTKELAFKEYEDRENWAKKMLINISKAGYFSSDRTINDYNNDIWKL